MSHTMISGQLAAVGVATWPHGLWSSSRHHRGHLAASISSASSDPASAILDVCRLGWMNERRSAFVNRHTANYAVHSRDHELTGNEAET
jgi:hypothetical protein